MSSQSPLVLDCGSFSTLGGFGGEDEPRIIFPTVIGKLRNDNNTSIYSKSNSTNKLRNYYVGNETTNKIKSQLSIEYPIINGQIQNLSYMENGIWNYTFYNQLRIEPNEHSILLTTAPITPKYQSENILKTMFETYDFENVYLTNPSVLSLYSCGKTTGIVLDMGYNSSKITSIYEGYQLLHSIKMINIGGENITEYLNRLLFEQKNYNFTSVQQIEHINKIKETMCYISNESNESIKQQKYELPDGSNITLDNELFKACEILFNPKDYMNSMGIHYLLCNSINKCDKSIHKTLYNNIILCGGSSMFNGMSERLKKEVNNIKINEYNVNIIGKENRNNLAWIGGSILCTLNEFKEQWVSKQEFDENGMSIMYRKCVNLAHIQDHKKMMEKENKSETIKEEEKE